MASSSSSSKLRAVTPSADVVDRVARARSEWERQSAELVEHAGPALRIARECAFDALAASLRSRECMDCDQHCVRADGAADPVDVVGLTQRLQAFAVDLLSSAAPELLATALSQIHRCEAHLIQGSAEARARPARPRTGAGDVAVPLGSRLIGSSAPMKQVRAQIAAAARGHGAVFVVGESGTGKELAVRSLHDAVSAASHRPLVVVNCATLPSELMESELFGHRKGAYTGAQRAYEGLVRAAHGGILFLDEITEMKPDGQAKLLRVLEEGAVRPIGTWVEVPVAVRFVASTNRDPVEAVRDGFLRADVYHRLNVHRIEMPPLREHRDDIPELVGHFTARFAARGLVKPRRFSDDAIDLLRRAAWPGNVRGLRNAVMTALSAARGPRVEPRDLPAEVRGEARAVGDDAAPSEVESAKPIPTFAEAERALIVRALEATGGNKRRAAQQLGISRHRLYDKLRKYEIDS